MPRPGGGPGVSGESVTTPKMLAPRTRWPYAAGESVGPRARGRARGPYAVFVGATGVPQANQSAFFWMRCRAAARAPMPVVFFDALRKVW